ncbi:MAG: hypothetical protein IT271_02690 [Chitinophagales bacterium]|nr:hypothetical protein [Chitinophagales bacterium]
MKTVVKSIAAICIAFFTLTGTTSCSKDKAINPGSNIDQNLVGRWEKQTFLGNNVSVIQETFNADGTGAERTFRLDDGATEISNEKVTSFTWFVKSAGVIRIKNQLNEEGDVTYFVTDNRSALRLTMPSGQQLIMGPVN